MIIADRDAATGLVDEPHTNPRLTIATVCLSGTLEDKLAAAAAAGFHGVEIFESDLIASPWSPAPGAPGVRAARSVDRPLPTVPRLRGRAARRVRAPTCAARSASSTCWSSSAPPPCWSARRSRPTRSTTTTSRPSSCTSWPTGRTGAACASPTRRWRGGGSSTRTRTPGGSSGAPDHPALGLCLDSFHVLSRGDDPAGIRVVPGAKVFHLQLADAPRLNMDVVEWSRHHRLFPGLGSFDLTGFVGHVLTTGYDGPAVARGVQRRLPAGRPAARRHRRHAVAARPCRSRSASAAHAPVRERLGPPGLPPAPRLGGHVFTELAVDEVSGPVVARTLTALGFAHTGAAPLQAGAAVAAGQGPDPAELRVHSGPSRRARRRSARWPWRAPTPPGRPGARNDCSRRSCPASASPRRRS